MFTIDIQKIPNTAGVYLFKDKKGIILYIGKAKNLKKRLAQYFSPTSLWKQEMLAKAVKVDFLTTKNESEALYLEDNLIKQHQPEYNNLLKADNSYVYIKITKEKFPQIFLTRKKSNDGAIYIGPKNDTIQLKKFLQYLRQILKFRGCKKNQFRQGKLCSDYYFGLCKGRCKEPMKSKPEEYKDILKIITSFFKGNTKPIEHEIHEQLETAITQENFEWAAHLRDIYSSLQGFVEKQDVVLPEKKDGYLALIKTIGIQHLYTILVFTQGKLMDIITSKEQVSDIEKDSLELAIQRTFGAGNIQKNQNETIINGFIKPKTPLPRKETKRGIKAKTRKLKPLLQLAENFLESYIISNSLQEGTVIINDLMKILKDRYKFKKIPYRIECVDISHFNGSRVSGGLSCLIGGVPYTKGYRRYKIHSKQANDYAALEEVLQRRFQSGTEFPDVLIIDGGKGQLNIVKKLCKDPERKAIVSQRDIIALGKGEARKKSNIGKISKKYNKIGEKIYTLDEQLKIHETAITYDQADKILLKARDEAHRFANAYRKKQMSQEFHPCRPQKLYKI